MNKNKLIFSLKDLYINNNFTISKQIEQTILDQFVLLYNLTAKDVEISQGMNSLYDFRILNKLFELKIMSTPYYNIEVSRWNGSPSGLSASKSDYYLIINPGYLYQKEVMKIRVVTLASLKEAVKTNCRVTVYEPNNLNPLGSVCHQLDPKGLAHDFVGTFDIVEKTTSNNYYIDFNSINFFPLGRFCSLNVHNDLIKSAS